MEAFTIRILEEAINMLTSYRRSRSLSRRSLLRRAAALSALGPLFTSTEGTISAQSRERPPSQHSTPSDLKITDVRGCTIASNYDYPIIRIDTNQGVSGLGEVFCNDMVSQALLLKPFLVGKNPLQIDDILANVRRFAWQGSSSGGYSGIDIALHDLAGKIYGVPCWRLLGNKLRDRLILYCDTEGTADPKVYGERMRRRQSDGFQFFKMDLYTRLVAEKPGAVDSRGVATPAGLKYLCEIIQGVRDAIGWNAPLAADHFGNLTVNDAIRYARAFEPYMLAWAEDFITPFTDWEGYKKITEATETPILVGEMIFGLEEGYKPLLDNRAVDLIHPDVCKSGGMLECKRIADYAAANGIAAAVHMANSPVGQMASAHFAATIRNFVVLEYHAVDIPWWPDLVTGVGKPIADRGYQTVPDTPGLGIELNENVVKQHLSTLKYAVPDGYFEPTTMFDKALIGNHPRESYEHLDEYGKRVKSR
jgi:L-alanine-DL-glutamate epimerase-like enolase superfamily enzyme